MTKHFTMRTIVFALASVMLFGALLWWLVFTLGGQRSWVWMRFFT